MKHTSVKLDSPVEFINITPLNPLISKCQIKVCYVSDEPNRNRSVITKEVAKELANSIPGCPIVGYYNEAKEDFEEHNRVIDISNGEVKIKDTTVPYGFVDMNAKCWFKKFIDDGENEREYLMTEGYLWTGQYPECQRIIEQGNNQSMELDEKTLEAQWSKDDNGKPQFFIINKAIMSKLCILGEEAEPCFEGSQITKVQFSFDDGFEQRLYSMMNELKDFLDKGGVQLFNRYAVEIGDALWCSIHRYLVSNYPNGEDKWSSTYAVEGIYEEGAQKFMILRHAEDGKFYRLNFDLTEQDGFVPSTQFIEVTKTYVPAEEPQFSLDEVQAFENEFKAKEEDKKKKEEEASAEEGKDDSEDNSGSEDSSENEDDKSEEEDKKKKKDDENFKCGGGAGGGSGSGSEKKKTKHSAEELEIELSELQTEFSTLKSEKEALEAQLNDLIAFKNNVEREQKEAMIESFYMLTDEMKAEVVENIDKYSLDDIEKELSVICFRNKINFSIEEDEAENEASTTFTLDDTDADENIPAWVKAAMKTAQNIG